MFNAKVEVVFDTRTNNFDIVVYYGTISEWDLFGIAVLARCFWFSVFGAIPFDIGVAFR